MDSGTTLADYVVKYVNQTNRNIFLTGKAGTGKTTLLKEILRKTHKNAVVVAPTGIAALNAGGTTIHSMFQLPFAAFIPAEDVDARFSEQYKFENRKSLVRHFKMNSQRLSLLRNLELLVVDEVSMLRADMLDAMDFMLRRIRRSALPFGGVQVLFIGDLLQLPPIVKPEEWQVLKQFYRSIYFFESLVVKEYPLIHVELDKVYRQSDALFLGILNNLRNNKITQEDITALNQYYKPDFNPANESGYITLTTHNNAADLKNQKALDEIEGEVFSFEPEVVDDFPERIYPLEGALKLKIGAQVMFVKNDLSAEKRYYNGKIAKVIGLEEGQVTVEFIEDKSRIIVDKYEWTNIRYIINEDTKEVDELLLGTYTQYPLKLAWAITVHKSQGLTFQKAILDVSRAFAPGQAYVALSRLTSLDGLVLLQKFTDRTISSDNHVVGFSKTKTEQEVLAEKLNEGTKEYIKGKLALSFSMEILSQEWRNLLRSFENELPNSPKQAFRLKLSEIGEPLAGLLSTSRKFQSQLQSLFLANDAQHIEARCEAAFDFFYKTIATAHYDFLLVLEEVKRIKRMKSFFEELIILDSATTDAVLGLLRSKIWLKSFTENSELSKDVLYPLEVRNYKQNLLDRVTLDYTPSKNVFNEDETYYSSSSKKKAKKDKKSTIDETFDIWKNMRSIEAVAEARKLTKSTIYGHMLKLVLLGKASSEDVLGETLYREIIEVLLYHPEKSNTEIQELTENKYSYDELRIARAGLD